MTLTIGLIGGALVGCGGGGGDDAEEGHEAAAQYAGAIGSSDVAHGAEVYGAVCGACHNGGAPAVENLHWDAARMRQQVREGEDRMPPISETRVSADDLEAVLAYLTTIGAVDGELPAGGGDPAPLDDTAGGDTGGEEDLGDDEEEIVE